MSTTSLPASYNQLYQELHSLLAGLERDSVGVDDLSRKLDEAYLLLESLKSRLTETEFKVEEIINSRSGKFAPSDDGQASEP